VFKYKLRNATNLVLQNLATILIIIFVIFPIFWLILTAFKPERYVFSNAFIFPPTFDNFKAIFGGSGTFDFTGYVINSVTISLGVIAIAIPLAIMAAYVLSRYVFKGSTVILIYVLATQFIPRVVVVIPFFAMFRQIGLIDTRLGLIIIDLAIILPYAIWLLKGFTDSLPTAVEEQAIVDGCNEFQVLAHITFPMMAPGVIVTCIFSFIMAWNEFLFALIITRDEAKTMTIGLLECGVTNQGVNWDWMSAAGMVIMVPVFIISMLIRKHFVEGLTMGAVKG
jgi:ABC-type glycerol-3-phosphate transport system permease component